jgi:hypothetical protein
LLPTALKLVLSDVDCAGDDYEQRRHFVADRLYLLAEYPAAKQENNGNMDVYAP